MRTALLSLIVVFAPAFALAQTPTTPGSPASVTTTPGSSQTIDEIRQLYHVHAGPLYVNPGILLKELGADTNVFNQPGDQKTDFTFTLTPKADVALPFGRRGLLRTTAAVDGVYYAHYESERSLDPQATLRGEAYANRLTLFAQGEYLNTRQRPNYEIDLRSRHVEQDFSGGLSVRLTTRFTLEGAVTGESVRYDGDAFFLGTSLRETLTRDTNGYRVIARERLSALTTVAVRYDNDRDRFPFSPERNADSFRAMAGVEFRPRALISGSAYVGYREFQPRSSTLPEYAGVVSHLSLSYTLLGATTFGVSYDRDVEYSYEVTTPYFLDNSLGLYIRRAIGGRFDVIANAARHRYDYRDVGVPTFAPVDARVDTTDNYGANVGYRMKRNTRLGFGASYYTRTSTRDTFRQYDGLRFGTTMTYGF